MELHRAGSGEPKRQTGAPEGVGQIQGAAHENSALCAVGSKLVCRFLVELKNRNGTETLELWNPAVLQSWVHDIIMVTFHDIFEKGIEGVLMRICPAMQV